MQVEAEIEEMCPQAKEIRTVCKQQKLEDKPRKNSQEKVTCQLGLPTPTSRTMTEKYCHFKLSGLWLFVGKIS